MHIPDQTFKLTTQIGSSNWTNDCGFAAYLILTVYTNRLYEIFVVSIFSATYFMRMNHLDAYQA